MIKFFTIKISLFYKQMRLSNFFTNVLFIKIKKLGHLVNVILSGFNEKLLQQPLVIYLIIKQIN